MAGLRGFRMALIQLAVGADKAANLQRASEMVKKAAERGASLVSLPECFNCPYGTQYFAKYAETVPGETTGMLSRLAKELKIYLIGGSIPERSGELLYNCSTVFGPDGTMLAKFRKMHLFDIDVPGKIRFQESEVLTGGDEFCTFNTEWCKVGLAICYDVRFSELASIYAQKGCKLMCFPGAFNMTTGPAHWKLLLRARSLDHQVYVAGISPARDDNATYVAWGNSMLVSPWGQVVTEADEKETILYGDVDLDYLDEVRAQVPIRNQKRTELYTLPATK